MNNQNQVGGVWKRKTRKNEDYLYIKIDNKVYYGFKNRRKTDKQPDFNVYKKETEP